MQILNIAAYKFVPLNGLEGLQAALRATLAAGQLKGTVLLAEEGINLFLAAPRPAMDDFFTWFRQDARFADLVVKESWSAVQPFGKLMVKIKPEIIRMNHPAIQPASGRAPAVSPATLKRWLDNGQDDSGQPVVLLDTRNTFETDVGSFHNAIDWRLAKFTDFPQAFLDHKASLAGKAVVSYCTGGIRCEKAALFMRAAGLDNVYQLDGGILQYFEVNGPAHFDGHCFVFDDRRAVDARLEPQVQPPPG